MPNTEGEAAAKNVAPLPQKEVQDNLRVDSEHDDTVPTASAEVHSSSDKAVLDDNTIQEHSAVLSARLQSQPEQVNVGHMSDGENPADQSLPVPINFKATLVDASGPIPGLEDF